MRIGAIAENLIERLVMRMNVAPTPMIETQMAFSMARGIMAAVKLGVFETLEDGERRAADIASACGTDANATVKLLNFLVGARYLTHRAGHYGLTAMSRKWLLQSSPHSIADKVLFQLQLEWDIVAKYEDYITTGTPLDLHESMSEPADWESYQKGMRSLGGISADEVTAPLSVPAGATALLDIGGSHGYYSVCLCRKHDGLNATILDLPKAVEQAAPILAKENMGERVVHRPGNALEDDLGDAQWDVVFMSQLIHHFSEDQNRELVGRIATSLKPGGICALLDSILPEDPAKAGGIAGIFDLYFAATSQSGTWPLATIQSWQRDAGLSVEKTIWLRTLPGGAVVIGRRT